MLVDLDEVLFVRGGWFALGAGNERVPGVVVPSLGAGLGLVGEGPVRAVVGRLRPQVRVVDVDLSGARGEAVVELLAAWCRQQGLWHLVRPSGGAPGRAHVFVVVESRLPDLLALVAGLRDRFRVGRPGLDVRDTVRPLSSPHRSGTVTRPYGDLSQALGALRGHPWAGTVPTRRAKRTRARVTATEAAPARRRARQDLPAQWRAYLEQAVRPVIRADDRDSRSNYEAAATAALLRCGHDAGSAWQVIEQAHPGVFTKARSKGRDWWVKYVWNRAVTDDASFTPVGEAQEDPQLAADRAHARAALEQLAWSLPARARPALLLVGHAVLDRIRRAGSRRVPVPERDLVLDTGLTDRKTIRAQLRRLHGPMGILHTDAWDPARRRDSSSFEFEIPQGEGVREIPPPSFHTPSPPGLWVSLPRSSHQLWQALASARQPASLEQVTVDALLTESPTTPPSPSQLRTARTGLRALAEAGLAVCSADGTWTASRHVEPDAAEHARAGHEGREAAVTAEREAYRAGSTSQWGLARAAAIKAQRAREVAWWAGLEPVERSNRRERLARRFETMSVLEQEQHKAQWADRRIRRGVDEPARYRAWLRGLPDEQLAWRSSSRAAAFAAHPTPIQQALVASWERHRNRYALPHRPPTIATRIEQHDLLPNGAHERDQGFWQQETLDVTAVPANRRA